MPTQRDLARHLGISPSTVSLALRGSPLIAKATRQLIRKAAADIGYHPNPMVSSLMEHIRSSRPVRDAGCLAIVVDFPDETQWQDFHLAYRQQFAGIRRRAELRGYRTECFFLRAPGMSPAVLDRILYSRGIVGLILAGPRQDSSYPVNLQWERYACIKYGYTWEETPVDCVSADFRQHVELAFANLEAIGCRKIGYCMSRRMIPRANANWIAGYHLSQRRLPPSRHIPMFVTDPSPLGHARFENWLKKWKPDAVIGGNTEWHWMQQLKGEAPIFCSRYHYPETRTCTIEENSEFIGETLCDLLIEKIIHNDRGLPALPRLILIPGSWGAAV